MPRCSPFRAPRLDADRSLTYDIFKRQRELAIEGFTYPSELLPVNPFDRAVAAVRARRPRRPRSIRCRDAKDCENWLRQIDDYVRLVETGDREHARGNAARLHLAAGPRCERVLPLLEPLGEERPANVFYYRCGPCRRPCRRPSGRA